MSTPFDTIEVGQMVFAVNRDTIASVEVLQIETWTKQEAQAHPDASFNIGEKIFLVKLPSLMPMDCSEMWVPRHVLHTTYPEADAAWTRETCKRPNPLPYRARPKEERHDYH